MTSEPTRVAASGGTAFLGSGWAFPLHLTAGQPGLSSGEQKVRESILLILGTEPGERVMRPDFGAGLRALAFEPMSTTTAALVRHRVAVTLIREEPRIDSVEVAVQPAAAERARLDVTVSYRIRASNTFYNLVYPFYLLEGGDR